MRGRIPDAIIDRPMHGFAVPLDRGLRAVLRPLAIERLSPRRVLSAGLLNPEAVTRLLDDVLDILPRQNHEKFVSS
jgi:hypothetical protein